MVREEDAGQLDPAALPTGQGTERLVHHPGRQPEARGDPGRLRLGRVASACLELRPGARIGAHRALGAVRHRGLRRAQHVDGAVEAARRQDPVGDRDLRVGRPGVLGEETGLPGDRDGPGRGACRPARVFRRVVLPAPLRPTRPMRSPGEMWKERSDSSSRAPTRTSTPRTVIMGNAPGINRQEDTPVAWKRVLELRDSGRGHVVRVAGAFGPAPLDFRAGNGLSAGIGVPGGCGSEEGGSDGGRVRRRAGPTEANSGALEPRQARTPWDPPCNRGTSVRQREAQGRRRLRRGRLCPAVRHRLVRGQ